MIRHQVGKNTVTVEGDIIFSVSNDDTTLDMALQVLDIAEGVLKTHGRVLFLTDAQGNHTIHADARRAIIEWSRVHPVVASAVFGQGFVSRAMLTLVLRAMNLVARNAANTAFFDTEAAARRWLDIQRSEYLARPPAARSEAP